ncbi:MAG: hypothetical protein QXP96_06480 [Thermoproteota archaeon]
MTATIPFLIVNGVSTWPSLRVTNLEVLGTAIVRESETVLGRVTIKPAAGTIALNIRNAADTADIVYFSETGEGIVTGGIISPSIGPAVGQKHTLPAVAADTVALLNASQTLYNKTLLNSIMNGLRNYSGTAKTVTETVLTLKDEVGPLTDRVSLIPMGIVYSASNPTGSGVTLTVVSRAVYTDGTTTDLRTDSVAAGGTLSVSFTPDGLYKLLTNGKVLQKIQLLAYCSAAPAAGYEPTVTLTSVAGVSF